MGSCGVVLDTIDSSSERRIQADIRTYDHQLIYVVTDHGARGVAEWSVVACAMRKFVTTSGNEACAANLARHRR